MSNNILTKTIFGKKLNSTMSLNNAIELLMSMELINTGQLAEMAISKKSKVAMCPKGTPNIDLISGVQIKHATVKKPVSCDYYLAYVRRNTTTAPICLIITNPAENGKQYFLYIPYSAHKHLTGSCISIYFGHDGLRSFGHSKWWRYQVDSFNALCKLAK